jgi:3-hydroxyacyl-[acyl-carrier-protein] dehydratase
MRLEYFEMIDRVAAFDRAARTIHCRSRVPEADASPVFQGHFPKYPLMPGVLLLETMAQASGYLALALEDYARMAFLVGFKEAKFRTFVRPGQELEIDAAIRHEGSGFTVARARIASGESRVCEAEVLLRLMPFPSEELGLMMRTRAARLGLAGAPAPNLA